MVELISEFNSFDFDELASFQRRAFGAQWLNPESRRIQSPKYYYWKYLPPSGPAVVATIRCNRNLVSTAAAIPVVLAIGPRRLRAWQVCDIATDPRYRGRRYFSRCLEALGVATNGEMIFCFANSRSRAGMTRSGYSAHAALRLNLIPLFSGLGRSSKWSEPNLSHLEAFADFGVGDETRLHGERSLEFLRWRYKSHPMTAYTCMPTYSNGMNGFVIVRQVCIFNIRIGVIMELWPLCTGGIRAGIDAAFRWAKETQCFALLAESNVLPPVQMQPFRWPISERFMFGLRSDLVVGSAKPNPILMQIGDWDSL
jgi:hypothetical protein